jgi:predicted membrane protein
MTNYQNKAGLIILALLAIAAGALLIAFNAGLLPLTVKTIVFSWQMLLIAIGVLSLSQVHHRNFGVVLIIVGAVFLLPKIPIPGFTLLQERGYALCWALLLIALGIYFLCSVIFGKSLFGKCSNIHKQSRVHSNVTGYFERNYVFSGAEETIESPDFRGGEINCVFGGVELDLSRAQMAEGTHTLTINTVFGGVELRVPPQWRVELRPTCVFGAFEDKRRTSNIEVDDSRTLIILASSVFGGGEIRS